MSQSESTRAPKRTLVSVPDLTLHEEINRGRYSCLYRATKDDREYAVKLITRFDEGVSAAEGLRRFYREGTALARFHHPNVVQVFDMGFHNGNPFLVMEYVRGPTV